MANASLLTPPARSRETEHASDHGQLYSQVLAELETCKKSISDAQGLRAVLRAQQMLRMQAQVRKSKQYPFSAGELSQCEPRRASVHKRLEDDNNSVHLSMHAKIPIWKQQQQRQRRQADSVKDIDALDRLKHNMMLNPSSRETRKYLEERYGIPSTEASACTSPACVGSSSAGMSGIIRGTNAPMHWKLPRNQREGCCSVEELPLDCLDAEIKHGLFHLINRGLLPRTCDLTTTMVGPNGVLHAERAPLFPFGNQFRDPSAEPVTVKEQSAARSQQSLPQAAGYGPGHNSTCAEDNSPAAHAPKPGTASLQASSPSACVGVKISATLDSSAMQVNDRNLSGTPDSSGAVLGECDSGGADTCNDVANDPTTAGTQLDESDPATVHAAEAQRQYETLMDDHSSHFVIIRKGATLDATPEFASFHRCYAKHWGVIADLLLQLESICLQYAVPLAQIDGKRLAGLAEDAAMMASSKVPVDRLLACLINIQDVADVLRRPGQRFHGPSGQDAAATAIQAHWRGHHQRRVMERQGRRSQAAAVIQMAWRGRSAYHRTIRSMEAARNARNAKFDSLQATLRQNWSDIKQNMHMIVHLPSLTVTHEQRASISNVALAESSQMARLCDTADSLSDVVYISPFPVDSGVQEFWTKVLQAGGVQNAGSRFRIIHPENYARLPERMSLAAKLLASPRAMQRLRCMLQGRRAYIMPGIPGDADIDVAVALDTPLMSAHPAVAAALASKSGARAVFKAARMNTAPGVTVQPVEGPLAAYVDHDAGTDSAASASMNMDFQLVDGVLKVAPPVHGERNERKDADLCRHLAEAMVSFPTVLSWLIKLEDEDNGRGHAVVDVAALPRAREELATLQAETGPSCKASQSEDITRHASAAASAKSVVRQRLQQICLMHLRKAIKIVAQSVFPDYRSYVQAVRRRGAVIEAVATSALGSPTVNMFIEPDGGVKIISTTDQIFSPAFQAVGHSFPQTSVVHSALADAASAIGRFLASSSVIGYVSVDFVVLRQQGLLRMWGTDLNLCEGAALSSFRLFQFLAPGEFQPRYGRYVLSSTTQSEAVTEGMSGSMNEAAPYKSSPDGSQQRTFVAFEALRHPGFAAVDYSHFFQACKVARKVFNVVERTGTSFALIDHPASGMLSTISVADVLHDALADASHTLDFIDSVASSSSEHRWDTSKYRQIAATVRYLADQLNPLQS